MAFDVTKWESDNEEVNDTLVSQVEQALGVKLPESYIALMKKWNGGGLPEEYQILIGNDIPENLEYYLGDGFWALNAIAGISSNKNNHAGIIYATQTAREWGVPDKVVALDGDAHTWVALDYRSNMNEPKVIFIETDNFLSFDIATNFQALIDQIIPSSQIYDHDGNIIY